MNIDKLAKTISEMIRQSDGRKTSAYDTTATVVRIKDNTVYVHIPGGVDETPIRRTVDAKVGDEVQVRISGGTGWIVGNSTSPPTDDTVAKEAIESTTIINKNLKSIGDTINEIGQIAGNTNQYFWHTEEGTDTGTHITEIPREDFLADPQNGGGNLLARSNGIAIRDGLLEMADFTSEGVFFYDGVDGSGNPILRAKYGHDPDTDEGEVILYGDTTYATLTGSQFSIGSSVQTNLYTFIEPASIQAQDTNGETSFMTTTELGIHGGDLYFYNGNLSILNNISSGGHMTAEGVIASRRDGAEAQVLADSDAGTIYLYSQASSSGNFGLYSKTAGGTYMGLINVNQSRYVYYNAYHFTWQETYNNDKLEFFFDYGASNAPYPKFRPVTSDWVYLGSSQCRWAACYVVGGVFNGSDRKIKSILDDFDWKIDDFIRGLRPVAYNRKHEDGTIGHRVHMGFVAQDVRDLANALNLGDMSVYSADVVSIDEEGTPIEAYYNGEDIDDEHLNWSLTYTEFIAPIVLEMQRLMDRVDELERGIS